MDEMIRYIFGSLRCSETAMRVFAKTLRKQRSFNRSTVVVATVMTMHMLIQDMEIRGMRDEIGNLKNEIKELKTCLPDQAKEVKEYFPNGKNSKTEGD